MELTIILVSLVIGIHLSSADLQSSFKLQLRLKNDTHSYVFIETILPPEDIQKPLVYVLNNKYGNEDHFEKSDNQTLLHVYRCEANAATRFVNHQEGFDVLFVSIQLTDGSRYEISSNTSFEDEKQESNNFIVKQENWIVEDVFVDVEWFYDRSIRSIPTDVEQTTVDEILSTSNSIETTEKESKEYVVTTPKPIPKKSRHLYLEIVAAIDSLVVNDLRSLLKRTEQETIEILKLYYLNVFIGVENIYRQSLIHETLDVHIRLSKIIFATDKNRLPWESYKNLTSFDVYRKSPNNVEKRPGVTKKLLYLLHGAYQNAGWNSKYSIGRADHIMTFTRLDLVQGAGSAYVSGVCIPTFKYSIIQEDLNLYSTIATVAHELGHNLGLDHDETENKCNEPRFRYIMSPTNMNTADRKQLMEFSQCSIEQLNFFVDNTTTTCWKNKIQSSNYDTKLKLGQIINIHQQCQLQYGTNSFAYISTSHDKNRTLHEENLCETLQCFKKIEDDFMYWQGGAFDGTICGKDRICQQQQCVSTNETTNVTALAQCPYGDLFMLTSLMNIPQAMNKGKMFCPDALNLFRSHGMDVNYYCYESELPFERLCCEECKKHRISQCGDRNSYCSTFLQYCSNPFVRVNQKPLSELCPHTCGLCSNSSLSTATSINKTESSETNTTKTRKYTRPTSFDKYTCIDSTDCSKLIKTYAQKKKKVKNWCADDSIMIDGKYFAERCPKYCSLCNVTSECDEFKLCQNNGTCIKDDHGIYQCLCSKSYYGTLCEYRQTCSDKPCPSKKDYCIQTQGENFICLSSDDKEKLRIIINDKKKN